MDDAILVYPFGSSTFFRTNDLHMWLFSKKSSSDLPCFNPLYIDAIAPDVCLGPYNDTPVKWRRPPSEPSVLPGTCTIRQVSGTKAKAKDAYKLKPRVTSRGVVRLAFCMICKIVDLFLRHWQENLNLTQNLYSCTVATNLWDQKGFLDKCRHLLKGIWIQPRPGWHLVVVSEHVARLPTTWNGNTWDSDCVISNQIRWNAFKNSLSVCSRACKRVFHDL